MCPSKLHRYADHGLEAATNIVCICLTIVPTEYKIVRSSDPLFRADIYFSFSVERILSQWKTNHKSMAASDLTLGVAKQKIDLDKTSSLLMVGCQQKYCHNTEASVIPRDAIRNIPLRNFDSGQIATGYEC